MAGDVERQPLAFEQRVAERRVGHAEGARLDAAAVGGVQRAAEMRLFDAAHAGEAMRRKDEARLGMPWSVRPGAIDEIDQLERGAARPTVPRRWRAGGWRWLASPALLRCAVQELEQHILLAALELEACRHGVAAALEQQSLMHRGPHHGAKID